MALTDYQMPLPALWEAAAISPQGRRIIGICELCPWPAVKEYGRERGAYPLRCEGHRESNPPLTMHDLDSWREGHFTNYETMTYEERMEAEYE